MPKKTKHFTGPFQNGSVNLGNGNISYVSMNHFEAATATKQEKGIAKKETLLPTKRVIRISPPKVGDGGGAAIRKQATATRQTSLERNPADYPGIKKIKT